MGKQKIDREAPMASLGITQKNLAPCSSWGGETEAGWLGDAGEYCGETRDNCDAVVLTNCEYCGETGENCEAGV